MERFVITLYSPNLGAKGVESMIRSLLDEYAATRLGEISIEEFAGDTEERTRKAQSFFLAPPQEIRDRKKTPPRVDLFMVERLYMPHPQRDGAPVVVYRTTLRIGSRLYRATCYTDRTARLSSGYVDLTEEELGHMTEHVGHASQKGLWESLFQVDRLRRFTF